ncbi:Serine/threonine-protein kinase rio1 [Cyphellophora attinorum]|uniref:Serine/threonine-protein kinase RIO1 n=1 Tax=Cyphellophora attinorum TaxID=1664694 RepID=A0A0N0NHN3_9EURO|nr:Serine/threonine-protein kinase rio1 [Phialophora attinorum]KPI34469.1 Serine/threonine-protein kinase rio1 [Phialophora attinorum]
MASNTDSVADGVGPTHTYVPNQGYVNDQRAAQGMVLPGDEQDQAPVEEEDDDYEDILDEQDDEDLMTANPSDLTKSYNRQRRLNEAIGSGVPASQYPKANPQSSGGGKDDQMNVLNKHAAKLRLEDKYSGTYHGKGADKSERATSEQVLDPRTRMILLQMINRNIVSEINGVISTGKEANVYHAMSLNEALEETHRAIKVYKTSILVFKDREKYVAGEYRFRHGFNKSSNRAIVKVWAEKEMRNLKRIHAAGIPSPEPLYLRLHVLAMSFLGDSKGIASPRLKDVEFVDGDPIPRWRAIYITVLAYMRLMYHVCHLIHADLSEYNILYHDNKPYIIDVSQSVEHDHPRSLDFLRMDIKNVNDFFKRKTVFVLSDRAVYDFILQPSPSSHDQSTVEKEINNIMSTRKETDLEESEVDNAVFRQQYIPQTLNEVYDAERDADMAATSGRNTLVYKDLLASKDEIQRSTTAKEQDSEDQASVASNNDSDNDSEEEGSGGANLENSSNASDDEPHQPRGKRFQSKEDKKAHKQAVKEEKREKRMTKMPKNVKKKLVAQKSRSKR